MEKQPNIPQKALFFIARANIFISICTASLAAYTQWLFCPAIEWSMILVTAGATFVMYNAQQLYLEFSLLREKDKRKAWIFKHKLVLAMMLAISLTLIYPVFCFSRFLLFTYFGAGIAALMYFLPFANLRAVPFLKSFIIAFVWTLVCIIAALGPDHMNFFVYHYAGAQFFFITALCILFNIKDVEEDRRTNTYTVPVLYGVKKAKIAALIFLSLYLLIPFSLSTDVKFFPASAITFAVSVYATLRAESKRHLFFYLYGVDGIILLQSVLGIVFLRQ